MIIKNCKKCGQNKPTIQFHKNKNTKHGVSSQCKECANNNAKTYYSLNFDKKREDQLIKRYGIDSIEYNRLLNEQNGLCKICNKPEASLEVRTGKVRLLSVDHCHDTSLIRGLLCMKCNQGIGSLKNSPELCIKAAEYLKNNKF